MSGNYQMLIERYFQDHNAHISLPSPPPPPLAHTVCVNQLFDGQHEYQNKIPPASSMGRCTRATQTFLLQIKTYLTRLTV